MKKLPIALIAFMVFNSCSEKKRNGEGTDHTKFFPVLSFIQSQVAHVDTSLYPILKIVTSGMESDTTYIPREEFRKEAEEFLSIPDLTEKKHGKNYREEKMFDETLGRVILAYVPEKDNVDLLRQEVIIVPTYGNQDHVKSIILEKRVKAKDGITIKRLLWQVDESFQVVSILEGLSPEKVDTKEIIWNRAPELDSVISRTDSTTNKDK